MKKLLDETTDNLTRALLVAGIEHRPPAANKAQLIVALGAGGAVGLFSSKAMAWLGTSAGKVTLLGVALGVGGAVYAVAPLLQAGRDVARPVPAQFEPDVYGDGAEGSKLTVEGSKAEAARTTEPSETTSPLLPVTPLPAANTESGAARDEAAYGAPPSAGVSDELGLGAAENGGLALSSEKKVSRRESASKRRLAAALRPSRSGPLPAVETPPAVGAPLAEAVAVHAPEKVNDLSRLDSEVRLVDEMHWAARRNDREALGRFVETYRLQFPDGQLKEEVAEFAVRLERPAPR